MAVNKVVFGGETLVDLTSDTVSPDTLLEGETAHSASGEKIVGKAIIGNGKVTIKQGGVSKGSFTMNQTGDATIELTDNNTTYGVATQTTNGLESSADKKKLDGIATGAEVNQNAFSNVVIGSTTISADSKTDSLTLAGSNVTLTPDATNDKVTIGITKSNVTSALGYTPPTTDTTYGVATSSALGLVKSGTDITVDSSGNVSVNDDSHNHVISNVDGLKDALDGKAASSHTHSQYLTSHQDISGKLDNSAAGADSLLSKITTSWTAIPTDNTYFIRQDTGGTNIFGRVKFSTLWSYIKGKADKVYSVLTHTHTKSQITDFPTSLPASDVYAWAKASSKPSYSWDEITSKPSTFTPASHTHSYAGSSSPGGSATSAVKLDSSAGSATQPVYFSEGKPVACTYGLNKTVPSNAVFTDTDTYDRVRYNSAIKCGTTAIEAGNIIVGSSGWYKHLKLGSPFDITYPILYANANISATGISANNYLAIPFTVTTTQSMTLNAFKPVFIKGKLDGTTFTPISTTPLTQETPLEEDGYEYILLGVSYNSNTQMYLLMNHPIFKYKCGRFRELSDESKYVGIITDELETVLFAGGGTGSPDPNSVTYGNGKFVAVGCSGATYYSNDGITWEAGENAGSSNLNSVTYGNGRFVSVGDSGVTYYSKNGINWTAGGATGNLNLYSVTYGNGEFVAVGNTSFIYNSKDGIAWRSKGTVGTSSLKSVTYSNGKFVAVGGSGITYFSEDGATWAKGGDTGNLNLYSVTYGNGIFVAVGDSGTTYYSEDRINWTVGGTAGGSTLCSVTYGNGKFVAFGVNGRFYYSKDSITWTVVPGNASGNKYSVTYGNGKFVAVGYRGGTYYLEFVRESKLTENVVNDLLSSSKELGNNIEELRYKTPQLISEGVVTNETITLDCFVPNSSYLLVTKANTVSTGKIYGSYIANIVTPEYKVFGTVANTQSSVAKTSNTGLTVTTVADGTVNIKVTSNYSVLYKLYKLL